MTPEELRRQPRPVRKSRRSPLLHVVPAAAPTSNDADGRSAPAHLGATLGFAPPATRWRNSPGKVSL